MEIKYRWLSYAAAVAMLGCTGQAVQQQEPERRVQFETSIAAYRAEHPGRPGTVMDALTKKQIVQDMTLSEVRLVLDAQGITGKQTERLWCEKKAVSECPQDCTNCRGLVITRWGSVIYLKGKGAEPLVFDLRHTENDRPRLGAFLAADAFLSYEIARAIEANQIIAGMTLNQISQALPEYVLDAAYKCDGEAATACTSRCANCVIDFVWQGNAVTLERKEKNSPPRVTRIVPISSR